ARSRPACGRFPAPARGRLPGRGAPPRRRCRPAPAPRRPRAATPPPTRPDVAAARRSPRPAPARPRPTPRPPAPGAARHVRRGRERTALRPQVAPPAAPLQRKRSLIGPGPPLRVSLAPPPRDRQRGQRPALRLRMCAQPPVRLGREQRVYRPTLECVGWQRLQPAEQVPVPAPLGERAE